jgi:phage gpG-like protein
VSTADPVEGRAVEAAGVRLEIRALPVLQRSGKLASSLAVAYGRDYAAVGTAKNYGAIQQLGGQAGRGHKVRIPARPYPPMLPDTTLTPAAEDLVLNIIDRYFWVRG